MARKVKGGGSIPVALYTCKGKQVGFDERTSGLLFSEPFAKAINEGQLFESIYLPANEIANDGNISILIVTPENICADIFFSSAAGGDSEIFFYEGSQASNNGTVLSAIKLNRNSEATNAVNIYHTPTVEDDGTILSNFFLPGGEGPRSTGTVSAPGRKWILKANTKYLLRSKNISGSSQRLQLTAAWVESND